MGGLLNFMMGALSSGSGGGGNPPITPTLKLNLVFDGNSITFGSYNTLGVEQYFPKLVRDYYATRPEVLDIEFWSYGIGGQALTQMLAAVDPKITSRVKAGYINILVVNEDINGILNDGATAQANFDNMNAYCQIAKNAGYDYILHWTTYYPRIPYNSAAWDLGDPSRLDVQNDFFTLVANADLQTVNWDSHRDLRNAPNLGGAREQSKNSHFYDSVHLADIGYQEIQTEVIDDLNGYLGLS